MTEKKGIGLVRLQVQNVGITKEIVVDFIPGVNIFQGDNGAGKSTILNSIKYALEGKKAIPADIIRHGFDDEGKAHRAGVILETTDFEVELEIYKGKDGSEKHKLVVKKDDFKRDAPLEFLKGMSKVWNDPDEIAQMTADKIYDILMEYAHIDLSAYDKEIENLKSEQQVKRRQMKDLGTKEPCEPVEKIIITDKLQELDDIIDFNNQQDELQKNIDDILDKIQGLNDLNADAVEQIEQLKKSIEARKVVIAEVSGELGKLPVPEEKKPVDKIKAEIKNAEEINLKAEKYTSFVSWKANLEKIQKEFDENKVKIKEQEEAKDTAIKTAAMPIAGITINDAKEVFLNDVYWNNLSESDRLMSAAQLIVNTTPENSIRYMVIHRGESILSERRKKLHEYLIENDYTCLMQVASEQPPDVKPGVFYIVDGEVKENE